MNESISKFINEQKCVNICCVKNNEFPYCFSSFYAFNEAAGLLYFKSSAETNHINIIRTNPAIAGTILPDKLHPQLVKGIQLRGIVLSPGDEIAADASMHYYSKFPFALTLPGSIWTIQLIHIKMTDSTKGFGKKISWNAELSYNCN